LSDHGFLSLLLPPARAFSFCGWRSRQGGIECRGAVPAQTVGFLPGTSGSATQAHRRSAVLLDAMVSSIRLENGIDDRQTRDPNRLHRKGFKLFWRWKSRLGRPRIPENLRQLIVRMVQENPTWGEERIAAELSVKLGILVSPRTVRAYWPQECGPRGGRRTSSQHWRRFVRNHAKAIVAADFLVAITAGFRVLYVFVVMEVGSRRILQCNVTAHPTAAWTLQQFREAEIVFTTG
jgi:hypothetical protein